MTTPTIKVITFDLDDTLWDLRPVLLAAEAQNYQWLSNEATDFCQRFSLDDFIQWRWEKYAELPELLHQISEMRIVATDMALQESGYSAAFSRQLAEQSFTLFIEARHAVSPFKTVVPLLEQLHQDYSLGVLTNGNANIFKLSIGNYFDFSYSAEQLNTSKPAAGHFLAAQAFTGAAPEEMIHIGDHIEHDILGAVDAGWHSIWFNPEQKSPGDYPPPSQQITCLSDVPDAITAIQAKQ